ncbi:MAG: hypothetical protein HYY16_04465 [Planctomycetes bacterium]|nr:hypothetical protein [Planctomycetota bacterium]
MDPKALERLKRRIDAPEWMYALALEACHDSIRGAAGMISWFRSRSVKDEEMARLDLNLWKDEWESGRVGAQRAVAEGKLWEETGAIVSVRIATCPRCMTRQEYNWAADSLKCPRCGGVVADMHANQGYANPGYVAGWNSAMEEHLRATINPNFRWDSVRDV